MQRALSQLAHNGRIVANAEKEETAMPYSCFGTFDIWDDYCCFHCPY